MMDIWKRLVKRTVFALAAMAVVMAVSAVDARADTYGDYEYAVSEDGNGVTITKYNGSLTELEIPGEIDGKPVISIGDEAFQYKNEFISVAIPDGVTRIGDKAFYYCENLTSVAIPDSVTSIGKQAFEDCKSLTGVAIPDSVTSIGEHAFDGCKSLTSVVIPKGVTSIEYSTFSDCENLTSVTIPDSVTSIGQEAFENCMSLTGVAIPNGVESLGVMAFRGCRGLGEIEIPDSVTVLGNDLFISCSLLKKVSVGKGVTSIPGNAFSYCFSLAEVHIPRSVETIEKNAFESCTNLKDVYYYSSEEDWKKINIDWNSTGNDPLASDKVTFHYIFNVQFNTKEGSSIESQDVEMGNVAQRPEKDPERQGYMFAGWFADEELEEEYDFSAPVQSDITIYAKWLKKFTVSFNSYEGTVSENIVLEGDKVKEPEKPSREGYEFGGWFTDEGLTEAYDFSSAVTSSFTLYAKWTESSSGGGEMFTVSFNSMGGSAVSSNTVEEGNKVEKPQAPKREGYSFAGWYTDEGLTQAYDFTSAVTSSFTLYAKWTKMNKITISSSIIPGGNGRVEIESNLEETDDSGYSISNISISMDLALSVMTEEERQRVMAGETLSISLEAKDVGSSLTDTEKGEMEERMAAVLPRNAKTGIFLDITLFKKIGDDEAQEVGSTGEHKVAFSVKVPDALIGRDRTYYLVHLHDGDAELAAQSTDTEFRAEADSFSIFCLSYADAVDENENGNGSGSAAADAKTISVSDNKPMAYSVESRGGFLIAYSHELPFPGKAKLTPESFGGITVSYNNAEYRVSKAKINVKKGLIQIKELSGADKDTIKAIRKETKGKSGLPFKINPYYVKDGDSVAIKTKKDGSIKSVRITLGGKAYKAKKTEFSYDSTTKTISFKGSNLNGSYTVK